MASTSQAWPFPPWLQTIYNHLFSLESFLGHIFFLASLSIYQYGLTRGCIEVFQFLLFGLQMVGPVLLSLALGEYTRSLEGFPPEAKVLDAIAIGLVSFTVVYTFTILHEAARLRPCGFSAVVNGILGMIFMTVLMLLTIGSGEAEWEYIKTLPMQTAQICVHMVKTMPRASYRYFILREKVDGGLLDWWMRDDMMDELVAMYVNDF